jgi:hypothetical protein
MQKQDKVLEIITSVLLALASLVAAWSAYQASAWSSEQATMGQATARHRLEATRALNRGGQLQIMDVMVFMRWMEAARADDQPLAQYYSERFPAELKSAFEAWLELDPANNPDAPSPFALPEYAPKAWAAADEAEAAANQAAERFQFANDISTAYVRNTLFTAMALFFGGIAGRFSYRPVRLGMLALAALMLLIGMANAITLPRI